MAGRAGDLLLRLSRGVCSTCMRICLGNQIGGSRYKQGNDDGNEQSLDFFHLVSPLQKVLFPSRYPMTG
jgi:hypothetical protein